MKKKQTKKLEIKKTPIVTLEHKAAEAVRGGSVIVVEPAPPPPVAKPFTYQCI